MQLDYWLIVGLTCLGLLGVSLIFLIGLFILYPLTPKPVVQKYFRPPYFSEAFVTFYSGFPTVLYRGVIFARLAANPSSGKVRNLTNVYKEFPQWYIVVAKILFWGFLICASGFLVLTVPVIIKFGM